jgi:hypothetical protein
MCRHQWTAWEAGFPPDAVEWADGDETTLGLFLLGQLPDDAVSPSGVPLASVVEHRTCTKCDAVQFGLTT